MIGPPRPFPYYTDPKGRKEIDGDVLFRLVEDMRTWNKIVDDNKKTKKRSKK